MPAIFLGGQECSTMHIAFRALDVPLPLLAGLLRWYLLSGRKSMGEAARGVFHARPSANARARGRAERADKNSPTSPR
jgi:hypothetical protein